MALTYFPFSPRPHHLLLLILRSHSHQWRPVSQAPTPASAPSLSWDLFISLRRSRFSWSDSFPSCSFSSLSFSQVARASALAFGVVYGTMKLSYLKVLIHSTSSPPAIFSWFPDSSRFPLSVWSLGFLKSLSIRSNIGLDG